MRWILAPSRKRLLKRTAISLATIYIACLGFIWWAMKQPPERFGRVMSKIPGPVAFLVFPFETLWTQARAGALHPGDAAPDFALGASDGKTYRLSDYKGKQAVVLAWFPKAFTGG